MPTKPLHTVVDDFDAIATALAALGGADRLSRAEQQLLDEIPPTARTGLDAGCGHGVLTRAAATRGVAMLGVDVSPHMVALARGNSGPASTIRYEVVDIMSSNLDGATFDVVMSVNVVHHLPIAAVIQQLAGFVRPGGRLLVQDVLNRPGIRYFAVNAAAALSRTYTRLRDRDFARGSVARLYESHGEGETYLEPSMLQRTYATLLPGARIIHHLEWRYSVLWDRPAS